MEMFVNAKHRIPVQMYSCTNRDGKIIPIKFKFEDEDCSIKQFSIIRITDIKEYPGLSISYDVVINNFDKEQLIRLDYHLIDHKWVLSI